MEAVEQLHDLARKFSKVNIQGLAHCKKVANDDPFDNLLGSTALRGEPDTNIVIYDAEHRQRVIETEGRQIKFIPKTLLIADIIDCAGSDIIRNFGLGQDFDTWESDTLRANISETLPVVLINEQGEEEKRRYERKFFWCCVGGGRGWRGTKRRRA
jgi:hypothetical protein